MLDSVIRTSDLAYRVSPRRGIIKIESENVVENLGGKKNSKMLSAKIISKLNILGAKFCKLESRRLDSKLEFKIFQLNSLL